MRMFQWINGVIGKDRVRSKCANRKLQVAQIDDKMMESHLRMFGYVQPSTISSLGIVIWSKLQARKDKRKGKKDMVVEAVKRDVIALDLTKDMWPPEGGSLVFGDFLPYDGFSCLGRCSWWDLCPLILGHWLLSTMPLVGLGLRYGSSYHDRGPVDPVRDTLMLPGPSRPFLSSSPAGFYMMVALSCLFSTKKKKKNCGYAFK